MAGHFGVMFVMTTGTNPEGSDPEHLRLNGRYALTPDRVIGTRVPGEHQGSRQRFPRTFFRRNRGYCLGYIPLIMVGNNEELGNTIT